MIEVLRVQRHDFMNHLQVILGLLQLQKYDRAGDYIKEVAADMDQAGVLTRLGIPNIVSVVLLAQVSAEKQGIHINNNIGTMLENGLQNEMTVAEIIREMLDLAVRLSQTGPSFAGSIDFEIIETIGDYVFQVSFCSVQDVAADVLLMNEKSAGVQGNIMTGNSANGITVITLTVPKN
ncbi:Spo0B domain-containing protein [Phosphitispora sp. TUW77]|uniref:Spo0B domain-containing protein n=1 Tax=Phosphitispora sp. TUW77 TaxID=3152361 RepID=UPI003AB39CEE